MKHLHRFILAAISAAFFVGSAQAQNGGTVTSHAFAIGKGAGTTGYKSLLCAATQLAVGQSAADPICQSLSGDVTMDATGAVTLATVNPNVGSFGSATQSAAFTVNAKGLITAASQSTITPAIGSITGLGTGCATFLQTPSSANLRACLTDEVGTGAAYFVGGALGTPASATLTNATGLPVGGLAPQAAFTFVGNNTSGSASPTAVDISALTSKASPASTDLVMISDQAASGAWKKVMVSSLASAGSVASIGGLTGAVGLGNGLTTSGSNIAVNLSSLTNSLGADVAMTTPTTDFQGPSIPQGSTGTWVAHGKITFTSTAGNPDIWCKLWDGTTVIDSGRTSVAGVGVFTTMHLSGDISSPAGNIHFTCQSNGGGGVMKFNASGYSKDSTLTAERIQ